MSSVVKNQEDIIELLLHGWYYVKEKKKKKIYSPQENILLHMLDLQQKPQYVQI